MANDCDTLIDEMLTDYHEKIHEIVHFDDLGDFLTDFLLRYKKLHPYNKGSVTEIDGVEVIDLGDFSI